MSSKKLGVSRNHPDESTIFFCKTMHENFGIKSANSGRSKNVGMKKLLPYHYTE